MRKIHNPIRVTVLALVATGMACGLGWPKIKPHVDSYWRPKSTNRGKSKYEQTKPSAKSAARNAAEKAGSSASDEPQVAALPAPSSNGAKPVTPSSPSSTAPAPTERDLAAAGLAGRLFLALDANHDGKLSLAELTPKMRGAIAGKAKTPSQQLSLGEFVAALEHWPAETEAAGTAKAGAGRVNAPVYLPKNSAARSAPSWFTERDKNSDGQLDLSEWPTSELDRFRALDKNNDGIMTAQEAGGKG